MRLFCLQYTVLSSSEDRRVLGELERSISEIEVEMVGQRVRFFQVKAKEALVRARFSMLKEMGPASSSTYGLERQR
jgi:hypothetical protein